MSSIHLVVLPLKLERGSGVDWDYAKLCYLTAQ